MVKIEKNDRIISMLNGTGNKEISFIFEFCGDYHMACSCGFCGEYNKQCMYDADSLYEEEKKKMGPASRIFNGTYPMCPECGNTLVYNYVDMGNSYLPVNTIPEVVRDDADCLAVNLKTYGILFENYAMEYCECDLYHEHSSLLVYDRKKKVFFISRDINNSEDSASNRNAGTCNSASTDLSDVCGIYDSYSDQNPSVFLASGLLDIARIFQEEGVVSDEIISDRMILTIEQLVSEMSYISTHRFLGSCSICELPSWADAPYEELEKAGVDVHAESVEEAFNADAAFLRESFSNLSEYFAWLSIKELIDSGEFSGRCVALLERMHEEHYIRLIELCNKYGCDIETAVMHVMHSELDYSIALEESLYVCEKFSKYKDLFIEEGIDDISVLMDINKPYSRKSFLKCFYIVYGFVGSSQYDCISQKPTLDNFISVMGINL